MKKLAISIVTYNRAKHIREDLAVIAQPTKDMGIDIYIFDGSTNESTRRAAEQYIAKGYDHIHYFHSDKQLSPFESVMQRYECAFRMPDAEYVWLSGDKFMIRPEHYSEIFYYIKKSYDIITIYGNILRGTRIFTTANHFADYAIVPITHFGSTIIKKKLIAPYDIQQELRDPLASSFGIQYSYLKLIALCEKFKGVVIDVGCQVNIGSRYNTKSGSYSQMWPVWIRQWYYFIKRLPHNYDNVKEKLYCRPDLQMGFFSFKELLRQRSESQFDWIKCWEYRKYIKKVIVMPWVFVLWISLFPQSIAKWIWQHYSRIEKVAALGKNYMRLTGEKLRGIQRNL